MSRCQQQVLLFWEFGKAVLVVLGILFFVIAVHERLGPLSSDPHVILA